MPKTILTAAKIEKMLMLRKRGIAIKNIAAQFGISMARASEVLLEHGAEKNKRSSKW